MSESTRAIILIVLIMVLLIAIAFVASNFMMRRAIKAVLKLMRDGQAFSPETAKTSDELGFRKSSMLNFKLWRDYRPQALQLLMTANIIQTTEDGRIFLSEENLARTRLEKQ
ncbi:MAG: hypothetical protein JXA46_05405 [Dehalococcoidales bacterium]|nr:hypothetical protein [Dehalococcoidales bacterium]